MPFLSAVRSHLTFLSPFTAFQVVRIGKSYFRKLGLAKTNEPSKAKTDGSRYNFCPSGPINVSYDTSTVQPPAPLSKKQRQTIVNKFKKRTCLYPNLTWSSFRLRSWKAFLPSIQAWMTLHGFHSEDIYPFDELLDVPMLYDTAAGYHSHIRRTSQFRTFSLFWNPTWINHTQLASGFVQNSISICFTNKVLEMETTGVVRPIFF